MARRALKTGILMTQQDVVLAGQGFSEMDRMMMKHNIPVSVHRESENFVKEKLPGIFRSCLERYAKVGEIRENTVKIATLMYLDKTTTMTENQKLLACTEWGGSPDFGNRGVWTGYYEFVNGSFINARKEGVKRSFTAFADHPADFVLKKMMYTVGPAIVQWGLASGLTSYLIRQAIPDDDERENNPLWRFAEFYRNGMANVSDYLQRTYHTIILPVDAGTRTSAIVTLPIDDNEQAWRDITWTALDSMFANADIPGMAGAKTATPITDTMGRTLGNFLPSSANGGMLLSVFVPWINTYALGRHSYDDFRQANILTDDELAARFRTSDAASVLLGHMWNSTVGGNVKQWRRQDQDEDRMTDLGKFINETVSMPGIQPSFGRFIRVVGNGQTQMANTIGKEAEAYKIDARLEAKRILKESRKQGTYVLPEYVDKISSDPYVRDYYMRAYKDEIEKAQKSYSPFLYDAMRSDNPTAVRRLLDMSGNYR
jgi:hypothetical protein